MSRGEHALSGHRSSHLAAGLSTATAGCSTAFAVFVVVFLTLSSTALAGFGADAAHLTMESRIASHEPRAEVASVSTIPAKLDALSHHLHHVTV